MPLLITQFPPIVASDGRVYAVHLCGVPRLEDGHWEGWFAFFDASGRAWHTGPERVQPSLAALEYWAERLSPVWLDGARGRAVSTGPMEAVSRYSPRGRSPARAEDDHARVTMRIRGRVVATDRIRRQLQLQTGAQVLTLEAAARDVDRLRVGQTITVALTD